MYFVVALFLTNICVLYFIKSKKYNKMQEIIFPIPQLQGIWTSYLHIYVSSPLFVY